MPASGVPARPAVARSATCPVAARVSLGYLSEVERGRKEPSSELLAAICEALDVALPDLLTEAAQSLAGATADAAPRLPIGLRHTDLRLAGADTALLGAPPAAVPSLRAAPWRAPPPDPRRRSPDPPARAGGGSAGAWSRPRHPARSPTTAPVASIGEGCTPARACGPFHLSGTPLRDLGEDPRYRRRSVEARPVRCHDGAKQARRRHCPVADGVALGGRRRSWPTRSRRPGST